MGLSSYQDAETEADAAGSLSRLERVIEERREFDESPFGAVVKLQLEEQKKLVRGQEEVNRRLSEISRRQREFSKLVVLSVLLSAFIFGILVRKFGVW